MGIVNATPDSFSDAGLDRSLDARVALARGLLADGAAVIDIGGESGVTNRPAVDAAEEIERVVPLISAWFQSSGRGCRSTPTSRRGGRGDRRRRLDRQRRQRAA